MRLAIHFRGKPLLAVDLTAQTPDDTPEDRSLEPPMGLSASGGGLQEKAEPMQPDTSVFGFGQRPESIR